MNGKTYILCCAGKGAGGIDGMQADELQDYLNAAWQSL